MRLICRLLLVLLFANLLISTGCDRAYPDGPTLSFLPREARVINDWKASLVARNDYDDTKLYKYYEFSFTKDSFTWKYKRTLENNPTIDTAEYVRKGAWRLMRNGRVLQLEKLQGATLGPIIAPYSILQADINRLANSEMWLRFQIENDYWDVKLVKK
ncbi:MAG: hypothetical protein ACKVTZ_14160 [Bacteroidia bacterium]